MTTEKILFAIGEISDDLITEVEDLAFSAALRARAVKVGAIAAAGSMLVAGALWYLRARRARAAA
jgi:hypothetical protein